MFHRLVLGAAALASVVTAAPAAAAAQYYFDKTAFLADSTNLTLDDLKTGVYGAGTGQWISLTTPNLVAYAEYGDLFDLVFNAYSGYFPVLSPGVMAFSFDHQITAFGVDVSALGTFGPSDFGVTNLNETKLLLTGYVSPGVNEPLFVGIIDRAGFNTVAFQGNRFNDEIYYSKVLFGDAKTLTGGVPEPASWAMLIAGFGLTGAVMRRRAAGAGRRQMA